MVYGVFELYIADQPGEELLYGLKPANSADLSYLQLGQLKHMEMSTITLFGSDSIKEGTYQIN